MKSPDAIAIVATSEDAIYLNSAFSDKSDIIIYSTTGEASLALRNLEIKHYELGSTVDIQTHDKVFNDASKLADKLIDNKILKGVFSYEGINLLELLINHFSYFFANLIFAYQNFLIIKKRLKKTKLIIFKKNLDLNFMDNKHNDLTSLVVYQFGEKMNLHVKILDRKKSVKPKISIKSKIISKLYKLIIFPISLRSCEAKILFFLPGSHAVLFLKTFKYLKNSDNSYKLIVHNLKFRHHLQLLVQNVEFIDFDHYIAANLINSLESAMRSISKKWNSERASFKLINSADRMSYLINNVVPYEIDNIIRTELPPFLTRLFVGSTFFSLFKPSLIVTSTDPDSKVSPFVRSAILKKIRTVTIQHGAYNYYWPKGHDFFSDEKLVWGSYYLKAVKKNMNVKGKKVAIIGSPFLDCSKVQPIAKGSLKKPRILILLTDYFFLSFSLEKIVGELLIKLVFADHIYIRTHPGQRLYLPEDENFEMANEKPLSYYFSIADIVITCETTAGFDALIAGKRIIFWNLTGTQNMPFDKAGVPVAKDVKGVISIINEYSRGKTFVSYKKRQKLFRELFYCLDGKSQLRLANYFDNKLRSMA